MIMLRIQRNPSEPRDPKAKQASLSVIVLSYLQIMKQVFPSLLGCLANPTSSKSCPSSYIHLLLKKSHYICFLKHVSVPELVFESSWRKSVWAHPLLLFGRERPPILFFKATNFSRMNRCPGSSTSLSEEMVRAIHLKTSLGTGSLSFKYLWPLLSAILMAIIFNFPFLNFFIISSSECCPIGGCWYFFLFV